MPAGDNKSVKRFNGKNEWHLESIPSQAGIDAEASPI